MECSPMALRQLPGVHLGVSGAKLVAGEPELARAQENGMDIHIHAEETR